MKPLEYHWDDVGAPPLTTEAGSILEIFKACLITGYGSKPSAGWKLQYDGWTAKGEQKLAFSVGDETEQELIYWLNDTSASANLSLWAGLNNSGDSPVNQITNLYMYAGHSESFANKEWHLFATKTFCLFLWEVKREEITFYNHEGTFLAFGAVKDIFGEFLPQIIIGNNFKGNIPREQTVISCGGVFLLPKNPFSDNSFFENHNQKFYQHSGIEYYLPTLCAYSKTDTDYSYTTRLYIPSILITVSSFLTDEQNKDWFKVVEKNGSKIIRFCGYYNRYLAFDIGSDWDNPEWLKALINS